MTKPRKTNKAQEDKSAAIARLDELRAAGQISTEDYIKLVAGLSEEPSVEVAPQAAPSTHRAAFVGLNRTQRVSAYRGDLPSVLPQAPAPAAAPGRRGRRTSDASTIAAAAGVAALGIGAKHVMRDVLSSGAEEQVASGASEAAGGFDWTSLFDGL